MRTPEHWRNKGFISDILVPLSLPYYLFCQHKKRKAKDAHKANIPVICIGNVTAGGAGKTPTAIAIAKALTEKGYKPAFITRGYGKKKTTQSNVIKVEVTHTAEQVGDEPIILAKTAPTYVHKNRAKAAKKAEADGANIIIMDDGLQHYSLVQDLRILVIDGTFGFGNELIIPAGPLRDKIWPTIRTTQAQIIIGDDEWLIEDRYLKHFPSAEIHYANIVANCKMPDTSKPIIAFAGLGNPDKFFRMLEEMGYNIKQALTLPDHHPYSTHDIEMFTELAQEHKAQLVTTEKDAVKLPEEFRKTVSIVTVDLKIEKENELVEHIIKQVS